VSYDKVDDTQVRLIFGLLFVFAFLTLHVGLAPALTAEYQPVVFVILGLLLIANYLRELAAVTPFMLIAGLLLASIWHAVSGNLDISALVRCLVGPFFVVVGPLLVRVIPREALTAIVYAHVLIVVCGIVAPDATAEILRQLGLRGAQSGWNTFLASEPSYAALNLVGVIALFSIRYENIISGHLGLLSGIALLATMSITGVVFGALVLLLWVWGRKGGVVGLARFLALGVGLGVLSLLPLEVADGIQRIQSRIGIISEGLATLDPVALFAGEASGAWRLLSNTLAALGLAYAPFGIGELGLDAMIQRPVEGAASTLIGIILVSEVYTGLQTDFVAATPLFNYLTFGGVLTAIPLLLLAAVAVTNVFRARLDWSCKGLFLLVVACGLFWQTALTSPAWWLLLGVGARLQRPASPSSRSKNS
jgi:hypothetical protein